MKYLKQTFILDLLIILTLAGAGFFSYKTYESYRMEEQSRQGADITDILTTLSLLTEKMDDEILESASYLLKRTGAHFGQLVKSREKTDQAFQLFQHTIGTEYRTGTLKTALMQARKAVDALPENITETLFHTYYLTVSLPLSETAETIAFRPSYADKNHYLQLYGKLMELQETTRFKNTVLYTLTLQQHPASAMEKDILAQIGAKEILPSFRTYLDESESILLSSVLSQAHYRTLMNSEQKQVAHQNSENIYIPNLVAWMETAGQKQAALRQVVSKLRVQMQQHGNSIHYGTLFFLLMYGSAVLLLLFVTAKLMAYRTVQVKNKKLYDETRREIELVFNPEQQKKLKKLIEKGQVDLIYRFLIQAIKDANRTKDLFLANMSHEIRTPLNGIVGFTQLLQETETTEEQKEFLTIVAKSSEHLLKIVNDILDLAKIKAQKLTLESIPFDPVETFETAIESYAGKAHKENIDLNLFVDPALPTLLEGDPTKISQILVNLLSNAIKFTPKNGEVNVTIEKISQSREETELYFAVSDTGIGITREQRKKIFQAFSQADVSTSRKYGGTGLGLSIAGRLIEQMGGKLGIRSILHEGSTFHFTLRLKTATDAKQRKGERMDGIRIGILNPHIDLQYYPDKNLAAYLAFTGAAVTHYTEQSLMAAKERRELPDILFIDHKFRQREGELEPLLDLDTRIILLTTGDQKRSLKQYTHKIDKILYKPVTLTKTLKALSQKQEEEQKEETVYFNTLHILVAEDNAINQKLITNILNRLGIEVTIANNGEEALKYRQEKEFDMLLMDIEMPVMGGMEATAKIRSFERDQKKRHLPVIALTANALSGDRAKYLSTGMDGYLAKPIQLDALKEILLSHFSNRLTNKSAA